MASIRSLRAHYKVDLIDDERAIGNGIIITLAQGYSFDPWQDNRVCGAETVQEAWLTLRYAARPYAGPYTD